MSALAVTASFALVACGDAGGADGAKVTVWFDTQVANAEAWDQWKVFNVDPFIEDNPGAQVEAVRVAADTQDQKQRVALAAGTGPDIITTAGPSSAVGYAAAGYLADLTEVAERNDWSENILPWALDAGVVDGKLVMLPAEYETLIVYYNKSLFDEHGWQLPTDRASLEAFAKTAEAAGVIPFAAGNASWPAATEWYVSAYLNQVAGPAALYDALVGDAAFTDAPFRESIQMMKDDFDAGWYAGGVRQYFTTEDPQKYAALADGQAAMMLSGSWELYALGDYFETDENPHEWDWAPLPGLSDAAPEQIFPLGVGLTLSANAASKNLDTAISYLEWKFSNPEVMWEATETIGQAPLPVKFEESDIPAGVDPRIGRHYLEISQSSDDGAVGYVSWTSFGPELGGYVVDNADKMLTGDLTVEAFCEGMQAAHASDTEAGLVPPVFSSDS